MLAEPERQHAGAQVQVGRVAAGVRLQERRRRRVGIDGRGRVQGAGGVAVRVVDGARRGGKAQAAAARGQGGVRRGRGRLLRAGQLELDRLVGRHAVREQQGRAGERDAISASAPRLDANLREDRAGGIDRLVERERHVAVAQVDAHRYQGGAARVVRRRQRRARKRPNAVSGQVGKRRGRHVEPHRGRRPDVGRGVSPYGGELLRRRRHYDPVRVVCGQQPGGARRHGRDIGGRRDAGVPRAVRVLECQARRHRAPGVCELVKVEIDGAGLGVQDGRRIEPRRVRVGAD